MKVAIPESVADDDNGMSILRVVTFRGDKKATRFRLYAEQIEERAGDEFGAELLDGAVVADGDGHRVADGEGLEQFGVVARIAIVEIGGGHPVAGGSDGFDGEDAAGLGGTGKRIEKHGA